VAGTAPSPSVDIPSTYRTETWSVSPSVDMLPFSVTIPATVPQRLEIPEGLMNYPVFYNNKYPFFDESQLYFGMHLLVPCMTKSLQNSCNDFT